MFYHEHLGIELKKPLGLSSGIISCVISKALYTFCQFETFHLKVRWKVPGLGWKVSHIVHSEFAGKLWPEWKFAIVPTVLKIQLKFLYDFCSICYQESNKIGLISIWWVWWVWFLYIVKYSPKVETFHPKWTRLFPPNHVITEKNIF